MGVSGQQVGPLEVPFHIGGGPGLVLDYWATLDSPFGLTPLTQRDKAANNVLHLLSLTTPRTYCPMTLNEPAPLSLRA